MFEISSRQYSADEVRKLTTVTRWTLRRCSICEAPLYYSFSGEIVTFNPSCDCGVSSAERHSWQDIADLLNRNNAETQSRWVSELSGGKCSRK